MHVELLQELPSAATQTEHAASDAEEHAAYLAVAGGLAGSSLVASCLFVSSQWMV